MIKFVPLMLRIFIAFGLGAAMSLSFAPFSLWWLAPFLLMVWIVLFDGEPSRRALWLGLAFGLGLFSFGVWWIRVSLHDYGGAPLPFAILATLLLSAYLGSYYLFLAYFVSRSSKSITYRYGFLFPIIGVILEVIRAHLFSGFPWLALGYTLTETAWAQWSFSTMGALLSSFWVYWMGGILYLILFTAIHRDKKQLTLLVLPIGLGVIVASLMIGSRIKISDEIIDFDKPIKVALLQGNVDQNEKFLYFDRDINNYLKMTEDAISRNDIVIWPETAFAMQYRKDLSLEDGFNISEFNRWASLYKSDIVVGMFGGDDRIDETMNSLVTFNDTEEDQIYHKYHLVPFGEYIPLRSILNVFNRWVSIPYGDLLPGERYQKAFQFTSTQARASASICFEAVFGDELRYQPKISEFLINVSNDGWFGDTNGPWQHLQITRARSIELARPIVRATNSGITAFINANGSIKERAEQFVVASLEDEIQPKRGLTAYVKTGDFIWLTFFVFILFLGSLLARFFPRKRAETRI